MNISYSLFKRIADFFLASILLFLLFPILALLSAIVLLVDGKPVFFLQPRPGYKQKVFYLIKFRTMRTLDPSIPLPDNLRTTKLGAFLRASSLDELPSLLNIIKGDLSFVGPRPLLCEYLNFYTPLQSKRHFVLPGLTGLAQIKGRNAITWQSRLRLDTFYASNQSFFLDTYILINTFYIVLFAVGITHHGQPMPLFKPLHHSKLNQ